MFHFLHVSFVDTCNYSDDKNHYGVCDIRTFGRDTSLSSVSTLWFIDRGRPRDPVYQLDTEHSQDLQYQQAT